MLFTQQLRWGKIGEAIVGSWIKASGGYILPVSDEMASAYKGPQIIGADEEMVSPDMFVIREGDPAWIEVKRKMRFTWHLKTNEWNTGIDRSKWLEYLKVQERCQIPVWMLFLHESNLPSLAERSKGCPETCPTGLFGAPLDYLKENIHHEFDNYGKGGMVYWTVEKLRQLATLEQVKAEHRREREKRFTGDGDIPF